MAKTGSSRGPFTLDDIARVSRAAADAMSAEHADGLVVELPSSGRLFVASDIHGDLEALDRIIELTGFPDDPRVVLLFLGDYVDKGPDSLGVLMLILSMKAEYPGRVFILRGNHETSFPTRYFMSFMSQLRREYGRDAGRAMADFNGAFDAMPLVAVSPSGLVAMHGGPPKSLSLAGLTHVVMNEILWSDVCHGKGRTRTTMKRMFRGRNVAMLDVDRFLTGIGKAVLLRGHSHTMKGVEVVGGSVLTVISANSLRRISGYFGNRAQRGLLEVDLSVAVGDAAQVGIRLF